MSPMRLTPGVHLGSYEVLAQIGAGGMGEVYRARDTTLRRDVALKVLPRELADELERRTRLLREARAAASLNHPNICTIHEVGEVDGQAYIAMELVEGEPLSARLTHGPLPPQEVLRYGLQLAEALAHAHERGVVHRDLKCANVMVTPEGRAKVLDFGLATLSGQELTETTVRSSAPLTQPGTILGTVPYMAPEQLRGQPADARSDVWALGVVLYEMAAGARPFEGKTFFEVSSAIFHTAPPPLPSRVPPQFQAVVSRCLEKEPARRYRRGGEVRAALETVESGAHARIAPWRVAATRPATFLTALVTLAFGLTAAAIWWDTAGIRERLFGASVAQIRSIAVLPLKNLSGDPDQEYFADGMTESMITQLAQTSTARVISRSSVMRFKSSSQPLPEIARALGVDAIVDGSVLRAGDRVRISAQLVDARTDRYLWARSFDRDLSNVLLLQSEVAQTIAGEIETQVERVGPQRSTTVRPVSPDAHEAYLRGRYYWNRRTEDSLRRAVDYFEQAIARDSGFALAYVGLADTYESLGFSFDAAVLPPREAMPRARAAAMKALELDDTSAEAHTSLAFETFLYEWNAAAAEQHFRRALALNPQYANAHHWYSHYLMALGRIDESLFESRRALELDPLNALIHTHLGWHYLYARDYDRAIETLLRALEVDPSQVQAHRFLGFAYQQKGRTREALAEMEKALQLFETSIEVRGELGHAYAASGQPARARSILRDLEAQSQTRYVSPYFLALVHAGLGDRDRVFFWLDRAVADRSDVLVYLGVEPRLDAFRSDPRFQALLRQVNLQPQ